MGMADTSTIGGLSTRKTRSNERVGVIFLLDDGRSFLYKCINHEFFKIGD